MSAASPTPSNMPPPPTLKRPRQSAGTSTPTGSATQPTTTGGNPRVKRRKNEVDDAAGAESSESGARGKNGAGGVGAGSGKGKDDDPLEPGEISTKIDFKTLPVETLYKYLEHHDLLPRWDVSPWSEEPCVPPSALYSAAPAQPTGAVTGDEPAPMSPSAIPQKPEAINNGYDTDMQTNASTQPPVPADGDGPDLVTTSIAQTDPPTMDGERREGETREVPSTNGHAHEGGQGDTEAEAGAEDPEEVDTPAPPTTRSKTAPRRKQPTPDASPSPSGDKPRPVITLSDVYAARDVLAERANAHWIKGLGGGQNKESETIVNFLYKMKVGPGRLLRVYNPPPTAYGAL